MNWIKSVIVDIVVTLFIVVAYLIHDPWMWWVIAIYSLLMIIAKAVSLKGDGFMHKSRSTEEAPPWFFHLLYGLNVLFLALASWWYLCASWGLIWVFSFLGQRDKSTT